jgi:hypothetical protein
MLSRGVGERHRMVGRRSQRMWELARNFNVSSTGKFTRNHYSEAWKRYPMKSVLNSASRWFFKGPAEPSNSGPSKNLELDVDWKSSPTQGSHRRLINNAKSGKDSLWCCWVTLPGKSALSLLTGENARDEVDLTKQMSHYRVTLNAWLMSCQRKCYQIRE